MVKTTTGWPLYQGSYYFILYRRDHTQYTFLKINVEFNIINYNQVRKFDVQNLALLQYRIYIYIQHNVFLLLKPSTTPNFLLYI